MAVSPPRQYATAKCLVIGCSGAISHIVRPSAAAKNGPLDGLLMMQSERVNAHWIKVLVPDDAELLCALDD